MSQVVVFQSPFADKLEAFIAYKRALGMRYGSEAYHIKCFDRWCAEQQVPQAVLTQEVAEGWCRKRPGEKAKTQSIRQSVLRQLAHFLNEGGDTAYVLPLEKHFRQSQSFSPYIFSRKEIAILFKVADEITSKEISPYLYEIVPMVMRLLYCCGLRSSEARNIKRCDVNLDDGVLTILNSKNAKDRLVPMSADLMQYMRGYCRRMKLLCPDSEYLFPNRDGKLLNRKVIYMQFRSLLKATGIPHYGRGRGPRVHDLRHTFAVHSMMKLDKEGMDLYTTLPILSVYMGHSGVQSTEKYLRLTAEVYPEIVAQMQAAHGDIIPLARKEATQ